MASAVFNVVQQLTEQRPRWWETCANDTERLLDCRPYGSTDDGVCHVLIVNPTKGNHPNDGGDACAAESLSQALQYTSRVLARLLTIAPARRRRSRTTFDVCLNAGSR